MQGTRRVLKLALPVAIAGMALYCSAAGQARSLAGPWNVGISVTGPGTISGPNGISCRETGGNCVAQFADGAAITLTASPDTGASFSGWFGDCAGASTTCTLTMNGHKAVAAAFTTGGGGGGAQAGLSMVVSGPGTVTGNGVNCGNGKTDCSELYPVGTVVTLTATPAAGQTFSGWGGNCSGNATTCTLTMNTARSVTALFSNSGASATLTVTVSGNGKVTGAGINCGQGNTDCSEVYSANTTVTLAEAPASGATFSGWSGACTGSTSTCTVVMNASKSLTATFSQGSTQRILNVAVGGSGRVSGPGISCGTSIHDCSSAFNDGTSVTLTATPAAGATFLGWGGACSGTQATCTVLMNAPRAVSASFSSPGAPASTFVARSLGRPTVLRTSFGYSVSLRFFTNHGASALLRLTLNGRLIKAFTFSPHAGNVIVGPFNVARNGQYVFRLRLNDAGGNTQKIVWNACLGCSGGSFTPAAVFVRSTGVTATRTATGWRVHVHFRAAGAGAANVRMTRGGRLVSSGNFLFRRGPVVVTLLARKSGFHRITLTTRNAAGRTYRLHWNVRLS